MIKKWNAVYLYFGPLILFAAFAQAEVVVIKGPTVSNIEYSAYLKVNSERIAPTQKYLNSHPSDDSRNLLLQKLAVAQQEFLSGSLENAKRVYQEVAELLYMDDWENSDLEAILFSYLRIAQLSQTEEEKDQWLKRSLVISSSVAINQQLFPPPLLAQRQRFWDTLPKIKLSTTAPDLTLVINGQVIDFEQDKMVELIPGRYRVTFLNNSTLPETRTLDAQEISKWRPNQQPMFSGSCPHLKSLWNQADSSEVYGGEKCQNINVIANSKVEVSRTPDLNITPNIQIPTDLPKPIYQRRWFWVGVGAMAVVALAASQESNGRNKSSTSYGF